MFEQANKHCAELSEKLLAEMLSDGYSPKGVYYHIRYIYNSLTKFCSERFEGEYSVQAGKTFIAMIQMKNLSKDQSVLYQSTVERLNHSLNGDFHWRPVNHQLKPYVSSCYDSIIAEYEIYLMRTGKTKTNIRHHIHSVSRFFAHMESIGIVDICKIKPDHVHERFILANDKSGFHKTMKMFFRYAYKYGLNENDISRSIPSVPRHKPVPSVYTVEEIEAILGSIDRNTYTGKRNYCIILMASKLGVRSCDIAGLSINDIHRTEGVIRLIQQKTIVPIEFPLLPDISVALEDYLNNARPDSCLPNVFLTKPRPVTSALSTQGIHAVVSGAIKHSGIDASSRRRGAHALRSSLASQLLEEGKTYSEIQQVLGQTSPDVARYYVRVEAERLRQCALEVPDFPNEVAAYFLERQVI